MSILRNVDDGIRPAHDQQTARQDDPRTGQACAEERQGHHEHAQAGDLGRGQAGDEPGRGQSCEQSADTGGGNGLTEGRLAQTQVSHDLRETRDQVGESQAIGQEHQTDPGARTYQLRTAPRSETTSQWGGREHDSSLYRGCLPVGQHREYSPPR